MEVRGRHGKSMLTISGVRLSDWGRFDCEALSRIGGHQKSMFLDIECKMHKKLFHQAMLIYMQGCLYVLLCICVCQLKIHALVSIITSSSVHSKHSSTVETLFRTL